jgi:hypothetical protein
MKCNRTTNPTRRARQILVAAGLSFVLATLPISRNARAQTTAASPSSAPAAATSMRMPNTDCTFAASDFGDRACATGKLIVFAPVMVAAAAVAVPMMVLWAGEALEIEPFVPAGRRNPCD